MKRSVERRRFKGQTGHGEQAVSERHRKSSVEEYQPGAQKTERSAAAYLYGVAPVLEALRAGLRPIERIVIAEGAHPSRLRELVELARQRNVPIHHTPRVDLARIVGVEANHQGVVATIASASYTDAEELLDALASRVGTGEPPLAIVLDGIEDPRNLGAILRTVECVGAHGVFVP